MLHLIGEPVPKPGTNVTVPVVKPAVPKPAGNKTAPASKSAGNETAAASKPAANETAEASKPAGNETAEASKPAVDSGWGPFGNWSACDEKCNGGTQSRSRKCIREEPPCVGNETQTRSC